MTEATTQHVTARRQLSPRSPESRSPALTRLPAVDNDYPNEIGLARFGEDRPILTRLPPLEPLDTNSRPRRQGPRRNLFGDALTDHRNYYSGGRLGALAVGVAVAMFWLKTCYGTI